MGSRKHFILDTTLNQEEEAGSNINEGILVSSIY
jgi:hypothetical protein